MTLANRSLAVVIGLLALLVVSTSILIGVIGYSPTPMWDMWDSAAPEQVAGRLLAPHNEHRIALSRLIFWTDIGLGRGAGVISTAFVYIFSAGHLVLLVLLARWSWPQAGLTRQAAAAALAAAFFFSGFQYENFLSGFQNQFTGVFFFASLAIAALALAASREDRWRQVLIGASTVAGLVGVVSMANGLLIFPVLFLLALVLDLRASAWIMAVMTVVTWTAYFRDLSAGSGGLLSGLLSDPLGFAEDLLAYAGGAAPNSINALAGEWDFKVAVARGFGAIAVLGVGAMTVASLRQQLAERPRAAVWAAIGLFVLGSGAITALGRSGFDDITMLSSRYGAATAVLWAVLGIWLVMPARGASLTVSLGVAAAITLLLARAQIEWSAVTQAHKYHRVDAEAALLTGVDAPDVYSAIYPDPARVRTIAASLREKSLAMFHEPWRRLHGQRLMATDQECRGGLKNVSQLVGTSEVAWRVSATASAPSGTRALAVADRDGAVVGLLVRGATGDVASDLLRFREHAEPVWTGYVRRPAGTADALPIYAVDTLGRALCRLDVAVEIDPMSIFRTVPRRSVGPALAGVSASIADVFPPDGHHESAGAPPPNGRSWASWAGSDENTGRIALKANVQGTERVAIPLVTGPATAGLRLEARVDGAVIIRLSPPADMTRWSAIIVDIPPGAVDLEVEAEDSSGEWGSWIGVGEPRTICGADCPPLPCPATVAPADISRAVRGGVVDVIKTDGDTATLTGWAADLANLAPSDHIVASAAGVVLACVPPGLPREDVAAAKSAPQLGHSGFTMTVPTSALDRLQVLSRQADGTLAPLQMPR